VWCTPNPIGPRNPGAHPEHPERHATLEDDEEFRQGGGQDNVNSEPVGDSQLAGDSEQGGEEDDEEPG